MTPKLRRDSLTRDIPYNEAEVCETGLRPLSRGLSILSAFTPWDEWLGNLELARRTGLPAPTANRLVKALVALEYLEYCRERRKYRLAPAVLSLGYSATTNNDTREISRYELQTFANDHRVFIAVCERSRLDAVIVEHCRSKLALLGLRVGEQVPLALSAAGWALLAALPKVEREYLMNHISRKHPDEWPMISRGIGHAISQIEKKGYCTFFGDWRREVISVATPMITPGGKYINSIVCSAKDRFLTMKRVTEEVGPALVQASGRIRDQLLAMAN